MDQTIVNLEKYLNAIESYFINCDPIIASYKSSEKSWSKKEILGHLIDSGINNLQRFTEVQFESKPYKIRNYKQDELVLANDYQNTPILELVGFWLSINRRIIQIFKLQNEETLRYEVKIDSEYNNLKFLMVDYVLHLKHHINQIVN